MCRSCCAFCLLRCAQSLCPKHGVKLWCIGLYQCKVPVYGIFYTMPPACIGPLRHRTLDAELEPVLLSKAAQFHLPGEWVSRLDRLDPERRQVRVSSY